VVRKAGASDDIIRHDSVLPPKRREENK